MYVHEHNIASMINKAMSTLFRIIKETQDQNFSRFGRNFNPKYPSTLELPQHKYSSECPVYDGKPKLMFQKRTSCKKHVELEIVHRCNLYDIICFLYQRTKRTKKEWFALSLQFSHGCKERFLICELCFHLVLLFPDRTFVRPNESLLKRWVKNPEAALGEAGSEVINHDKMEFAVNILEWAGRQKRVLYNTVPKKTDEAYQVLCLSIFLKILQFKRYSSLRSSLIAGGHLQKRTEKRRQKNRKPNALFCPQKRKCFCGRSETTGVVGDPDALVPTAAVVAPSLDEQMERGALADDRLELEALPVVRNDADQQMELLADDRLSGRARKNA
jgi:hypothetical protein